MKKKKRFRHLKATFLIQRTLDTLRKLNIYNESSGDSSLIELIKNTY